MALEINKWWVGPESTTEVNVGWRAGHHVECMHHFISCHVIAVVSLSKLAQFTKENDTI